MKLKVYCKCNLAPSWTWLVLTCLCLVPMAMSFFQRSCPCPFPPVSSSPREQGGKEGGSRWIPCSTDLLLTCMSGRVWDTLLFFSSFFLYMVSFIYFWLHCMQGLSSLTRDRTRAPFSGSTEP